MPQHKSFLLKLVVPALLFLGSGLSSTYLYYQYNQTGGAFLPGLLYTSTTVLVFALTRKATSIKNLLRYYVLMNLTCLGALLLTFFSSYLGVLVGIITGSGGALLTFRLTSRYIVPIRFSNRALYIWGGLPFLLTDLLYAGSNAAFDAPPLDALFGANVTPGALFAEVFVFWQLFVGMKLFLTLLDAPRTCQQQAVDQ